MLKKVRKRRKVFSQKPSGVNNMPQGRGTYGSKVGRPSKKKKGKKKNAKVRKKK